MNTKTSYLIVLLLFSILSCNKEKYEGTNSAITLTGRFDVHKKSSLTNTTSSITQASKVIVFDIHGNRWESNVIDGFFSVSTKKDNPVGLIFADNDYRFLGYLTLNKGFEAIPLNFLNDTVAQIDLGLLKDSISSVVPSNDFVFSKFNMTPEIVKSYAQACINFSKLIQNPDVNRNGKIDLYENKFYFISFLYFVDGGTFSDTLMPQRSPNISFTNFRILFHTKDPNAPQQISFILSDGTNINSEDRHPAKSDKENTIFFSELLDMTKLNNSTCKVLYNNDTLYFDIPNQSSTLNNLTYLYPSFTFNNQKQLTEISWEYYCGNTTTINHEAWRIINNVIIQIGGLNYSNRLYDSPQYTSDVKNTKLPSPIDIDQIGVIYTTYYDNFGNNTVISFKNKKTL
ncbi:MAG: hypothetical protein N2662_00985 [Bacteroidales bacterium]|nr:hypothetical protein [Bacteroidales bacterium]